VRIAVHGAGGRQADVTLPGIAMPVFCRGDCEHVVFPGSIGRGWRVLSWTALMDCWTRVALPSTTTRTIERELAGAFEKFESSEVFARDSLLPRYHFTTWHRLSWRLLQSPDSAAGSQMSPYVGPCVPIAVPDRLSGSSLHLRFLFLYAHLHIYSLSTHPRSWNYTKTRMAVVGYYNCPAARPRHNQH
jgi:hypothetical protein